MAGHGQPPVEHQWKPGQSGNPAGINGWTKARERVREILAENAEDMSAVLTKLAKNGDTAALKLALGALIPAQKHEVEHQGEVRIRWADEEDDD